MTDVTTVLDHVEALDDFEFVPPCASRYANGEPAAGHLVVRCRCGHAEAKPMCEPCRDKNIEFYRTMQTMFFTCCPACHEHLPVSEAFEWVPLR